MPTIPAALPACQFTPVSLQRRKCLQCGTFGPPDSSIPSHGRAHAGRVAVERLARYRLDHGRRLGPIPAGSARGTAIEPPSGSSACGQRATAARRKGALRESHADSRKQREQYRSDHVPEAHAGGIREGDEGVYEVGEEALAKGPSRGLFVWRREWDAFGPSMALTF